MRLFHNTEPEAISNIPCNSQHLYQAEDAKGFENHARICRAFNSDKLVPKQSAFTELQLQVYSGED